MVTNSRRKAVSLSIEKYWGGCTVWVKRIGSSCHSRRNSRANPLCGILVPIMWPKKKRIGSRQSGCSSKVLWTSTLCWGNFTWILSRSWVMASSAIRVMLLFERIKSIRRIEGYSTDWELSWLKTNRKWSRRFVSFPWRDCFFLQYLLAHFLLKRWFRMDQLWRPSDCRLIKRRSRNFGPCSWCDCRDIAIFKSLAWSKKQVLRFTQPSRSKMSVWQMKNTARWRAHEKRNPRLALVVTVWFIC